MKLAVGPHSSSSVSTWVWCPFCRVAGLQQQEGDEQEDEEGEEEGSGPPATAALARRLQAARELAQRSRTYLKDPAAVTKLLKAG